MKLYILANTKYPYSVCNVKGPKLCIVNFIVEKDGSITNLTLLKKVTGNWLNSNGTYTKDSPFDCPDYDNEAIRVNKINAKIKSWKARR